MRLGLDSGHMEEEGCWECHRAAKFPVAEAGSDAEADIRAGSLRENLEAEIRAWGAKGQSAAPRQHSLTGAGAGMASHRDRQHLESSLRDDIAADGCHHCMKPWPEPSRALHKAVEAEIRFSPAACALPSNRENKPETENTEIKVKIRQASKQALDVSTKPTHTTLRVVISIQISGSCRGL